MGMNCIVQALRRAGFGEEDVAWLEKEIDFMGAKRTPTLGINDCKPSRYTSSMPVSRVEAAD